MKRLLFALILFASPAFGQSLIQRSAACQVPGNTSKLSCSLSRTPTSGNTLRIIEIDRSGAGTRSVAGFTQVATYSGSAGTVTIFTAPAGTATSFTIALPNAYNPMAYVQEDSYPATMESKASASGAFLSTPQVISAGTLTATGADYIMVGCEDNFGAGGLSAGSGYNAMLGATFVPGGFEDRLLSAAGNYAANATLSRAQYLWSCLGVAFKGGSSPPPPPPQTCTATGTVTVNGQTVPPLSMSTTFNMPGATVGTAYSQSIATAANVTGGVPPYAYQILSGNLPAGLSMSGAGVISGTPTAAGTSSFSVQVTDSSNTAIILNMDMVAYNAIIPFCGSYVMKDGDWVPADCPQVVK